jgi:hypothetical protein
MSFGKILPNEEELIGLVLVGGVYLSKPPFLPPAFARPQIVK